MTASADEYRYVKLMNIGMWRQQTCPNMALWFVSRSITHQGN